jgi:hypothetical protein
MFAESHKAGDCDGMLGRNKPLGPMEPAESLISPEPDGRV